MMSLRYRVGGVGKSSRQRWAAGNALVLIFFAARQ